MPGIKPFNLTLVIRPARQSSSLNAGAEVTRSVWPRMLPGGWVPSGWVIGTGGGRDMGQRGLPGRSTTPLVRGTSIPVSADFTVRNTGLQVPGLVHARPE